MKAGLIDISQEGYITFLHLRPATSSEVYGFWLAEQLKPLGIEIADSSLPKPLSPDELRQLNDLAGLKLN